MTHREIFERYVYAGAITRNPGAVAELFTEDGVYEAPLVPGDHALPRVLEGREAIRAGVVAYHREPAFIGTVDAERSGLVLHETGDPDVFIAEVDAMLVGADGQSATVSLVQIFRVRDGRIAHLRDYFAPPGAPAS
ncbi:nuclear transport factor 2 family protein [Actinoplanes sp. GCM10030250]|uniref:nuclear transport factor 2 family protein n=1 Tax=Actinoplanes sp. GCM10030250 TaxID=3273376 RepID=UPI0036153592